MDLTAGEIRAQDTLTGAFADVLKIEESLASRLAARLAPAASALLAQKPATDNLAAHQLVTDARALYALGRFAEARSALLRATELDPRYALAWALLAKSSARLVSPAMAAGSPTSSELATALHEATTAVNLNPDLVEGHIALALAYRGMGDRDRSGEAARRAAALDSRNGEARIILGDLKSISPGFGCSAMTDPDGAEAAFKEGLRLDPLAGSGYINLTTHRWWMGQRDRALEAIDDGLAAQPGNVLLRGTRPFNLLFAGRVEEAEALLKQRIDSGARLSPFEETTQAYVALKRHRFDDAADRFRGETVSRTLQNLAIMLITSVAHFESGRPREGGRYLARAVQVAPECAAWAETVPALAPYRATPEFGQAVRRARR